VVIAPRFLSSKLTSLDLLRSIFVVLDAIETEDYLSWPHGSAERLIFCSPSLDEHPKKYMNTYVNAAIESARVAGELIRRNLGTSLTVNVEEAHDIKLELDVSAQELITKMLLKQFPDHAVIGEEGSAGSAEAEYQWIIDPIDGTVNFFYGIPHFCISIALQERGILIVGTILDPIKDELWHVFRGEPAFLNDRPINVSARKSLSESIVSVGLSKSPRAIEAGLKTFNTLIRRTRKCRMMGSAALDLAYVATGRFDAYIERSVNLWDIAAGWLLVEAAGGKMLVQPSTIEENKLSVTAWNGQLDLQTLEL
jgi:myo-inositol-1(or 4)-monophosphatase